jgi:hypothetical protein
METTTAQAAVVLGREGGYDGGYFLHVRLGDDPKRRTYIRVDLTAEQYAQLVTQQQVTVTAEVKRPEGA